MKTGEHNIRRDTKLKAWWDSRLSFIAEKFGKHIKMKLTEKKLVEWGMRGLMMNKLSWHYKTRRLDKMSRPVYALG